MRLLHVKKSIFLFLSLILLAGSVHAQQADIVQFPTAVALEQAVLPVRDRVELAQRFLGVGEIPSPPASAPARRVGEQETFWVSNSDDDRVFQVRATLRTASEHIYLWVESGVVIPDGDLRALADAFDAHIYPSVRDLWGSENTPGIDGDAHVYALFASGLGSGVGGYFISEHTYPIEVVSTSNQHEMFFFNLDTLGTQMIGTTAMQGLVAHEFQHMIRFNLEANEDVWLNEGLSVFTEAYLGYDRLGHTLSFLYAPDTQVNTWAEDTPREPHYGAALMFVAYLYERYGLEAIHALSSDPTKGMTSVDNVLRELGEPGVNEFFADWVVANALLDSSLDDGSYGYDVLASGLPSPLPLANVTSYPFLWTGRANQYSADYFVLENLEGVAALDVSMAVLDTAQLVPIKPESGRWMWYSNRGDFSDTHVHADGVPPSHWHLHFGVGGRSGHPAGGHAGSIVPTAMGAVFAVSSLRALMLLQPFGPSASGLALPALLLLVVLFGLGILSSMSMFGVVLARALSMRVVERLGQMAAGLVAVASMGLGAYWILS